MAQTSRNEGRPAEAHEEPDPITITADIGRATMPRLYAAMAAVPRGKQRAQRLRALALTGLMYEESLPPLGRPSSPGPRLTGDQRGGADDLFAAPVEE